MAKIRHVQVSERDCKSASARVALDDLASTVSAKMQVLFPAIGGWNVFFTPKENDHVVILRYPNGDEEGLILGKTYTATKMPQNGKDDIFLMVSDDGKNFIKLDGPKGTLTMIIDQIGDLKYKNLNTEVYEHTYLKTETQHTEVEKSKKTEVGTTIKTEAGESITTEAGTEIKTMAGIDINTTAGGNIFTESGAHNTTQAGGDINEQAGGKFYMGNSAQNMCKLLNGLIDEIIAIRTFGPPPRHRIQPDTVARLEAYKNQVKALLKEAM